MGLATSEIAANTIPCCCDNPENPELSDAPRDEYNYERAKSEQGDEDFDSKSEDLLDDDDDFMEDPNNVATRKVIDNIEPDLLDYQSGDLWGTLDRIFESYQPQELIDSIEDNTYGLRHGLQTILDDFTQNALFQSVINTLNHRKKPFTIVTSMAIGDHPKSQYQTQPLWFYGCYCIYYISLIIC